MSQAQNRPQPREPSLVWLWALVIFNLVMWFWAVVGPLFVVFGALSFFIDLEAIGITLTGNDGEPVGTTWQKMTFMALGVLFGVVGIGFLWLRRRGWLKDGLPGDEGQVPLGLDAEQAARARFNPRETPRETDAIRPGNEGVREEDGNLRDLPGL
jgi:hypothetical protein